MSAIAGIGGVMAIALAIGLPIWMRAHGRPSTPMFSLFAGWGIAALGGAYACLHTYLLTDPPPKGPPRGGLPITVLTPAPAPVAPQHMPAPTERRAA